MSESSSNEFRARLILYGASSLLLGCLFVIGFVVPKFAKPEPGTLLGMVELHLGMAELLPDVDKQGKKAPFKEEHLHQAEDILDDVEEQAPGLGITSEYRAFASWIRGDFAQAKKHYLEALSRYEGNEELANKTLMNLAEVELVIQQGSRDTASVVAFLDKVPAKQRNAEWYGIAARAYHRRNESAKRTEALGRAVAAAGKDRKSLEQVADIAYQTGDSSALAIYQKVDPKSAGVWYRIALLEHKSGNVDKALQALESCNKRNSGMLIKTLSADKDMLTSAEIRKFLDKAKSAQKQSDKSPAKQSAKKTDEQAGPQSTKSGIAKPGTQPSK